MLEDIVENLELNDLQKEYMRSRWLGQISWMEKKSASAKKRHYMLRLTALVGGVLVPIIISLDLGSQRANNIARWISVGLGGTVAIASSIDEFLNAGERWRHYRRTAESLKIQGWQFSQLGGLYQCHSHSEAFPSFVSQIESILGSEVELYVTKVAQEIEQK